jgi:hypothetical protein
MRRTVTKVNTDQNQWRIRVVVSTDPCEEGTDAYLYQQRQLLQQIADVPSLLSCGPVTFERVAIYFIDSRWVADATATLDDNNARTVHATTASSTT